MGPDCSAAIWIGSRIHPVRRAAPDSPTNSIGSSDSLGPCDFKDFVAQSHTPDDHCVRFAVVVTFPDATLVTRRALPLTWAGLSPAGSRQLRLAHRRLHHPELGEVAVRVSSCRRKS